VTDKKEKDMINRLIYWLCVRGKKCKHFCICCKYYKECSTSLEYEKER
jgi:hypothetical protein